MLPNSIPGGIKILSVKQNLLSMNYLPKYKSTPVQSLAEIQVGGDAWWWNEIIEVFEEHKCPLQ